eukprot:scaffold4880_cov22-Cyclotella_meneghiniana.AAC.1
MVERSTTVVVSTVSLAGAGGIATDQRALSIKTMVKLSTLRGWLMVGLWTLSACRRADMCLVFEISRLTSHNV